MEPTAEYHRQADPAEKTPDLRWAVPWLRRLQRGFAVACAGGCVATLLFWARSHWRADVVASSPQIGTLASIFNPPRYYVASMRGVLMILHNPAHRDVGGNVWSWASGSAESDPGKDQSRSNRRSPLKSLAVETVESQWHLDRVLPPNALGIRFKLDEDRGFILWMPQLYIAAILATATAVAWPGWRMRILMSSIATLCGLIGLIGASR
jgi:hypothetical protein